MERTADRRTLHFSATRQHIRENHSEKLTTRSDFIMHLTMKNKLLLLFVSCVLISIVVTGCGSGGTKDQPPKVTTRWKHSPKPVVGNISIASPEGIVIEQAGDQIEVGFFNLKEGGGFNVEKKISQGKYYADKQKLVLPIGPIGPNEFDQYIAMNVYRIEISLKDFKPETQTLQAKWVGNGPANAEEFVRVQD
jgi:hypothetical protein